MKIFIGADHRGFELKKELIAWLRQESHQVVDEGNSSYDVDDDYPDFALATAKAVAAAPESRGVVICGSGVGVAVAANKVKGIRAATAHTPAEVNHARHNDNINVLALAADHLDLTQAKLLINQFLTTEFKPLARFTRRLAKIDHYESLS